MQVDTSRKNDDDTQSFETPRKHNNITPEIPEKLLQLTQLRLLLIYVYAK